MMESSLIKDGSPPPTDMNINMVFTLPIEFKGAEEEVAQMCLGPKKAVFEKPEESSQHMKSLYVRGHMKVGRDDNELVKTNLTFNGRGEGRGGGATRRRLEASSPWSSPLGASHSQSHSSSSRCKVTIVLFLAAIGLTSIVTFPLFCTNS
jgi:hypothetical protein